MKSMTMHVAGFSFKTVSAIQETLICVICSNVLENPYQAPCGCRFCFICIRSYLKDKEQICPGQTEYCYEKKLNIEKDLRADTLAKRELSKVLLKCSLPLCNEEVEAQKIKDHLSKCSMSKVLCLKCKESVIRSEFDNHNDKLCKEGLEKCKFCNETIKRKSLEEEHYNYDFEEMCSKYTEYCPNKCEEGSKVLWISHRLICKTKYLECPYKKSGCISDPLTIKEMALHATKEWYNHIEGLMKHIDILTNENEYLKNDMRNVTNDMVILKQKLEEKETKIESLNEKFQEISGIKESNSKILSHFQTISKNEKTTSYSRESSLVNNKFKSQIDNLKSEMKTMKNNYEELIKKQVLHYEMKGESSEGSTKSLKIPKNVRIKDVVFVWEIENFYSFNTLISPSFYTHTEGYKMDLSLEKVKKNYMSMYARLRCGAYDEYLEWPLRVNIILQIVDQEDGGRNYERLIRFDKYAGTVCNRKFLTSTGDFGFSKFIAHEELRMNPYLLKNNKLIIHCYVEDIHL